MLIKLVDMASCLSELANPVMTSGFLNFLFATV